MTEPTPTPGPGFGPPMEAGDPAPAVPPTGAVDATAAAGLELQVRSQWSYARSRFFRHRLAVAGPRAPDRHLRRSACSRTSSRRTRTRDRPQQPPAPGRRRSPTTSSARTARARRVQPRDLGDPHVARGRHLRRVRLDDPRPDHRRVAGYYRGWIDNLLMRITDLVLTLPALAILLALLGTVRRGQPVAHLAHPRRLLLDGPRAHRARHLPLAAREGVRRGGEGFGRRRRCGSCSATSSRTRMGPVVVNATLAVGTAILVEAALSFLGFGIRPPTPSLGVLIADGETNPQAWWITIFPGLTIVLIVLCVNFVGDGLRDALDPTQRRVRA